MKRIRGTAEVQHNLFYSPHIGQSNLMHVHHSVYIAIGLRSTCNNRFYLLSWNRVGGCFHRLAHAFSSSLLTRSKSIMARWKCAHYTNHHNPHPETRHLSIIKCCINNPSHVAFQMLYIYLSLCLVFKQNKHATVVIRQRKRLENAALGMFDMLWAVCFELWG